jgi:hypothetical protein
VGNIGGKELDVRGKINEPPPNKSIIRSFIITGTEQLMLLGKGKGKAIPVEAWTGPEGSMRLRHIKVVMSDLRTGRLYPTGNIPGTHFC